MKRSNHMDPSLQILFFLLISTSELAAGQSNQPPGEPNPYNYGRLSSSMAVIVVVLIAALFFMGFFSIYIRNCTGSRDATVGRTGAGGRVLNALTARGLDASTVETFPTFVYADVKTQKIGKGALECAICLNEFEDDETLRLLPKCDHVFHPHCIDAWLQGHVTCPVCRTNLAETDPIKPDEPEITATDLEAQQVVHESATEIGGSVDGRRSGGALTGVKLSRSHTTGHSVVLPGENIERFTLRLPEDLRKKIMANWKMNRSNSSGKPIDRSRAKSDRWLFRKTPSFLWRNRDDGSIRLGGNGSIRANAAISPTGDSVRGDRWGFLRNPSFLWRNSPVPSPRDDPSKDGEGTSSGNQTGTAGSTSGSVRLPV